MKRNVIKTTFTVITIVLMGVSSASSIIIGSAGSNYNKVKKHKTSYVNIDTLHTQYFVIIDQELVQVKLRSVGTNVPHELISKLDFTRFSGTSPPHPI